MMKIEDVANQLALSTDTIRRWERIGIIPPIKRNQVGEREFDQDDVKWLQDAQLLNTMHVSDDFQIEYVKLVQLGKQAAPARQSLLREQLDQLKDQQHCLLDRIQQMESMIEKQEKAE